MNLMPDTLYYRIYLDGVCQHLVQSRDAVRYAQIDGSITDFDNETSKNIPVDFVDNLELLASARKF